MFKGIITNMSDFNKHIETIIQKIPLYYDENKIWYKWNENQWKIVDETDILLAIKEETSIANISKGYVSQEILNGLKLEARKKKPQKIKKTEIQFKNKIYDLETNETRIVTPHDFSMNPIPHELGSTANIPTIKRLIKEWVGEEYLTQALQWIAYQIIPDYPIHRVMILNGSGSNGKSTFIELLKTFLGKNNYAAGDFESVFIRRFGTSILYKKLAILMPEADFTKIEKTAVFKSATGNDTIMMEMKQKNPIKTQNYAKVTISLNSLPITYDKTDAFYRRLLILDFPNKFTEKYDILSQIPEEEYNNLAKLSIELLKLLLQKGNFEQERTLLEKRKKYEHLSNPLKSFIEKEVTGDCDYFLTKREFAEKANKWLQTIGLRSMTNKEITIIMKEYHSEGWGRVQNEDGSTRSERVWSGIKWKEKTIKIKEETIVKQ